MYIVCVFAGVCTGKYTPEYTYVWRTDVRCLLPPLTSNFSPLRQGLSWTWSSLIKIDRLVRKLRDLSLTHQCQDYTGTCHCTHQLLLMWGEGCVRICAPHVCRSPRMPEEGAVSPGTPITVVSHHVGVGTKPRPSARAAGALNCWVNLSSLTSFLSGYWKSNLTSLWKNTLSTEPSSQAKSNLYSIWNSCLKTILL